MPSHSFKFWLPPLLWAVLIFILSSISLPPGPEIPYLDKLAHLAEYGLLSYLLVRAFKKSTSKLSLINIFFLSIIITLLYGITDEVHQSFVPNRTYDIHDIVADGIGGLVGACTWSILNIRYFYDRDRPI